MNERKNTNKKNLLLIAPSLAQGGFEKVCVETARIMREDYEVTLLIFDGNKAHYDVSDINVIDIHMPPAKSRAGKALTFLRRIAKIKKLKKQRSIDITYSFGSTANLANAFSHAGDFVVTSMRSSLDFNAPRRMRDILKGSDLMISCSKQMRSMLDKEYGFKKTALLYNPLDTEKIRQQAQEKITDLPFADLNDRAHVICAVGREDDAKGYWHLIKAFYLLSLEIEDVRLMIVGAGEMKRERALINELNMSEKVALTGVKKNPFPYIQSAGIFVLSSNHEGFPNVLAEAMALGKPVIATDCISGPREILLTDDEYIETEKINPNGASIKTPLKAAYGLLVPDMDSVPDYDAANITAGDEAFANTIKEFLLDKELPADYAQKSALRAGEFGTDRYRETLCGILNSALEHCL